MPTLMPSWYGLLFPAVTRLKGMLTGAAGCARACDASAPLDAAPIRIKAARVVTQVAPMARPTNPRRAATTEAGGRVVVVDGPANSRLFLNLGGKYLHRIERERRELYAGDHDLAIVVEVISAASTDPLMRDPDFLKRHEYYL